MLRKSGTTQLRIFEEPHNTHVVGIWRGSLEKFRTESSLLALSSMIVILIHDSPSVQYPYLRYPIPVWVSEEQTWAIRPRRIAII